MRLAACVAPALLVVVVGAGCTAPTLPGPPGTSPSPPRAPEPAMSAAADEIVVQYYVRCRSCTAEYTTDGGVGTAEIVVGMRKVAEAGRGSTDEPVQLSGVLRQRPGTGPRGDQPTPQASRKRPRGDPHEPHEASEVASVRLPDLDRNGLSRSLAAGRGTLQRSSHVGEPEEIHFPDPVQLESPMPRTRPHSVSRQLLLAGALGLLGACSAATLPFVEGDPAAPGAPGRSGPDQALPASGPESVTVSYHVQCRRCTIQYSTPDGVKSEVDSDGASRRVEFQAAQPGTVVQLQATPDSGTAIVAARIRIDGVTVAESRAGLTNVPVALTAGFGGR